jgi:hypothetical protein
MGKVFVGVGLSLDGFLAGPNRGPGNPLVGDGGTSIHGWLFIGEGLRLFEGVRRSELRLEQQAVTSSPLVTHLSYRVLR